MTAGRFTVGYAQQTITPSLEGGGRVYLAGFGHNRVAQTVHDDLYVRALALEQALSGPLSGGDVRLVLAALDLIGLSRHHCLEIERRVNERAPGTRLILACTHTHHGPDTIGFWGRNMLSSGVDRDYIRGLKDRITETVLEALSRRRPVLLRSGSVRVPGVARNARDPEIVDNELTCLRFCRTDGGEPLATVLIFPCHPEVLWDDNPHVTADYPGFLRRWVEAETGAPCIFFAGAIGGMMTPDVQEHTFVEAERMGETLARAAAGALSQAEAAPVGRLAHAVQTYAVPLTNPLFKFARLIGLLPRTIGLGGAVETEANLVTIGPVVLAAAPGELLPKLGLAVKAELARAGALQAGIIGLANDELGYILPQEDFVYPRNPLNPGEHYEETMSVGPEAGPRLLVALRGLFL